MVVVKDGRLLYENYFNGADAATLQDIRSAGKSITSIIVGIAIEQGLVAGVDQQLLRYFPEYDRQTNWDERKDWITLEDALTMRIGLDVSDGDYSAGSYGNVESYGATWTSDVLSTPASSPIRAPYSTTARPRAASVDRSSPVLRSTVGHSSPTVVPVPREASGSVRGTWLSWDC